MTPSREMASAPRLLATAVLFGIGCSVFNPPSTLGLACRDDGDCDPGQTCPPDILACQLPGQESTATPDDGASFEDGASVDDGVDDSNDDGSASDPYTCEVEGTTPDKCDPPDPSGTSPIGDCSPITQDCPADYKCAPYATDGSAWDSNRCVLVDAAPQSLGAPCTAEDIAQGGDDCDVGLMCVGGHCFELCGCGYATPTCEGTPNAICAMINDAVPLCTPACNPLDSDSCPSGYLCQSGGPVGFHCFAAATESVGLGDPCEYANACPAGSACVASQNLDFCAAGKCCAPLCTTSDGDCPAEWSGCVGLWDGDSSPDPCLDSLGFCGSMTEEPIPSGGCGADCRLLMHFDDAPWPDSSPEANSAVVTGQPLRIEGKFGGAARLDPSAFFSFDIDDDDFKFVGDFTIDFWVDVQADGVAIFDRADGSYAHAVSIAVGNPGGITGVSSDFLGVAADGIWTQSQVPINDGVVWHHVALARNDLTLYVFIDGVLQLQLYSESSAASSDPMRIGQFADLGLGFAGAIDELRILNGEAAWTSDFVPPNAPYQVESTNNCGWFSDAMFYGCGGVGADPTGSYPIACQETPVEGAPCDETSAINGTGCCAPGDANAWCDFDGTIHLEQCS